MATESTPAAEPVFDVYEYVIEGNTVLPADVVERVLTPHLGPDRGFRDTLRRVGRRW